MAAAKVRTHRHPHRSWLHLVPTAPELVPGESRLAEARQVLIEHRLAASDPEDPERLLPGPDFTRRLASPPGALPMAAAGEARGEVRIEAGTMRCYPDPGPDGFDSEPLRAYLGRCPGCQSALNFFTLRFPDPDPLVAACPGCAAFFPLRRVQWEPELPFASAEVTFGDLPTRPSLRGEAVLRDLEEALGTPLRELVVTL